jgi:hypothetical protein
MRSKLSKYGVTDKVPFALDFQVHPRTKSAIVAPYTTIDNICDPIAYIENGLNIRLRPRPVAHETVDENGISLKTEETS